MKCKILVLCVIYILNNVLAIQTIRVVDDGDNATTTARPISVLKPTVIIPVKESQKDDKDDDSEEEVTNGSGQKQKAFGFDSPQHQPQRGNVTHLLLMGKSNDDARDFRQLPATNNTMSEEAPKSHQSKAQPVLDDNISADDQIRNAAVPTIRHTSFIASEPDVYPRTTPDYPPEEPPRNESAAIRELPAAAVSSAKEFVPSPQLGQWSDQFDDKRILTENDNVFYPVRHHHLFLQHSPEDLDDDQRFLGHLPSPTFLTQPPKVKPLEPAEPSLNDLSKNYPKFNEYEKMAKSEFGSNKPSSFPPYIKDHLVYFPDKKQEEEILKFSNHHREINPMTWKLIGKKDENLIRQEHEPKIMAHPEAIPEEWFRQSPHFVVRPEHPYQFDYGHDTPFSKEPIPKEIHPTLVGEIATIPHEFYSIGESPKIRDFPPHSLDHFKHRPEPHWKKIVHVLAAAVPFGLLVSALTPHVIFVNPNDTLVNKNIKPTLQRPGPPLPPPQSLITYFPRHRSLDSKANRSDSKQSRNDVVDETEEEGEGSRKLAFNPLMDLINVLGNSLADYNHQNYGNQRLASAGSCEDRAFCELARFGAEKESDVLHKMLWKIASETPDQKAKRSGLLTMFKAIRENRCGDIKCAKPTSKQKPLINN